MKLYSELRWATSAARGIAGEDGEEMGEEEGPSDKWGKLMGELADHLLESSCS